MTTTRSLLATWAVLGMAAVAGAETFPTPLRATGSPTPGFATALALQPEVYAQLRQARQIVVTGFPLDEATRVDLALERFEVLAPDARIVRASARGEAPMARPDVVLLRGAVVGQPGSSVFLGLSPHGTNGLIRTAAGRHIISSGRFGAGLPTVIYDLEALPEGALRLRGLACGAHRLAAFEPARPEASAAAAGPRECAQEAHIAVETDWQFTGDLFLGDDQASAAYVTALIGAVSEIFARDVNVTLLISHLRTWADANDPWTDELEAFDQLIEFQDYYNANMAGVERHTAHFLSGRMPSDFGGLAYLPGLCQGDFAYGLSARMNGFFPYPLEDNHENNWDVVVVAHQLGHNFGAPDTHFMNPPVDQCFFGNCEGADQGTIMSSCDLCAGGVANIRLLFHQRVIDEEILDYLAGGPGGIPCELPVAEVSIVAHPQDGTFCPSDPVELSVLAEGGQPFAYQWRKDGVEIPGANAATYVIAAATLDDVGTYDVVVTNDCGSAVSNPAQLVIDCCLGDFDANGTVGVGDLLVMLATWGQAGVPADLDGGGVSVTDFLVLLGQWGPCSASCVWDLDGNGSVGVGDLLIMLSTWGQTGVPADFDGGGVSVTDLLILLGAWGPCPT
jgi:hypothetical protein